MWKWSQLALLLLVVFLSAHVSEQSCGTKFTDWIVPDKYCCGWFSHEICVNFSPSCDNHDRCYETCGAVKSQCDMAFDKNLRMACAVVFHDGTHPDCKKGCFSRADLYYEAVQNLGQAPFDDAQQTACGGGQMKRRR